MALNEVLLVVSFSKSCKSGFLFFLGFIDVGWCFVGDLEYFCFCLSFTYVCIRLKMPYL